MTETVPPTHPVPGGDVFRTISEWRLSDVPRVMETN